MVLALLQVFFQSRIPEPQGAFTGTSEKDAFKEGISVWGSTRMKNLYSDAMMVRSSRGHWEQRHIRICHGQPRLREEIAMLYSPGPGEIVHAPSLHHIPQPHYVRDEDTCRSGLPHHDISEQGNEYKHVLQLFITTYPQLMSRTILTSPCISMRELE